MKRRNLLLLGTLIILAALLVVYNPETENKNQDLLNFRQYMNFTRSKIISVEIEKGENRIVLLNRSGLWVISTKGDFPADKDRVNELIQALVSGYIEGPVGTKDLSSYGLGAEAKKFKVTLESGKEVIFRVGKETPDRMGSFIAPKEGNLVFTTTKPLWFYTPDASLWFKRDVEFVSPVDRIEVILGGRHINLIKEDGVWRREDGQNITCSTQELDAAISSLRKPYFNDVFSELPPGAGQQPAAVIRSGDKTINIYSYGKEWLLGRSGDHYLYKVSLDINRLFKCLR